MSHDAPHQRHQELAHTVLRTFYEALEPYFRAKDHVTREDLAKAFALMESHWPRIEPLFVSACQVHCTQREGRVYQPDQRRKDFLTRLVFSNVLARLPTYEITPGGSRFPHILIRGIQKNVTSIFHDKEYDTLNAQAQSIFAQIGTDDDIEIWPLITGEHTLNVMADKIFVRLLLRFKQFNHQRQVFCRNMALSLVDQPYTFDATAFCALFEALFSPFEIMLGDEDGRIKLDLFFGEETSEKLSRIFELYHTFRQGSLSG